MGGTIRLASIGGIPLYVHPSWLAIYALITWTLAVGYFPRALPEMPTLGHWGAGLIAALLLFVSVLLHELSHSFMAMRYGLRVRGITLHIFGGVSHLEDEPPSPRAEFLIAIVGPLTSFAIAGVLWALLGLFPAGTPRAIAVYLVTVNAVVGVFNLLPGFPLDGGRVLRAALWSWTGTLVRATSIASRVGGAFAVGLMALGVLQVVGGGFIGGIWLILIGLFLRSAAEASGSQVALREALGALRVRSIMSGDVVAVDAGASVDDVVQSFWAHHFTSFPVVADGRVEGLVSVHQVHRVPRESWPRAGVREIMTPLGDAFMVAPGDTALAALEKAARNGLGRLAVLDGGRLVGLVSLKDITHVLALRGVSDGEPIRVAAPDPAPARRVA